MISLGHESYAEKGYISMVPSGDIHTASLQPSHHSLIYAVIDPLMQCHPGYLIQSHPKTYSIASSRQGYAIFLRFTGMNGSTGAFVFVGGRTPPFLGLTGLGLEAVDEAIDRMGTLPLPEGDVADGSSDPGGPCKEAFLPIPWAVRALDRRSRCSVVIVC